jgi:hypothetical protein
MEEAILNFMFFNMPLAYPSQHVLFPASFLKDFFIENLICFFDLLLRTGLLLHFLVLPPLVASVLVQICYYRAVFKVPYV